MKKKTTERACPHCRKMRPLSEYLKRGNDAHSVQMKRVGEPYGRCKECRHSERDGQPRYYLGSLIHVSKRRRAYTSMASITVDHLMLVLQRQRGICPLTGLKLTFTRGSGRVWTNASVDRINPDLGYVQGNVRLVTYWANVARNSLADEDFFYFCNLVSSRHIASRSATPP